MKRKLITILLSLVMVFTMMPVVSGVAWAEAEPEYLCFTAKTAGATVKLEKHEKNAGSLESVIIQYSTDLTNWETFYDDTNNNINKTITLTNKDDKVYFRASQSHTNNSSNKTRGFAKIDDDDEINDYRCFVFTGEISADGNIMSLIDKDCKHEYIYNSEIGGTSIACFAKLFFNCTGLTKAPKLLAKGLGSNCYREMFSGCTSLGSAPELKATDMNSSSYEGMFSGCTSLKNAPELKAVTLQEECYKKMFSGCTSLESAPELKATSLYSSCYEGMFSGCTSLESAPTLPATTLTKNCYKNMFSGCTSLKSAPELGATTMNTSSYEGMFSGCTSLKSAPTLPATTLKKNCYKNMFSGCTSLESAPAKLPAEVLTFSCYEGMFSGCTSLSTAPQIDATVFADTACEKIYYQTAISYDTIQKIWAIGEKGYDSFSEALKDASNGTEIDLLVDALAAIEVVQGKNVVIDMNDHVLFGEGVNSEKAVIINNGVLKVTDSTDEDDFTAKYFIDLKCADGITADDYCPNCHKNNYIAMKDGKADSFCKENPGHDVCYIINGGIIAFGNEGGTSENYFGGGICNYGELEVENISLVSNYAVYGGGIGNTGKLKVKNVKLMYNNALFGGAIFSGEFPSEEITSQRVTSASIEKSEAKDNQGALYGGGILLHDSTLCIKDTILSNYKRDNSASDDLSIYAGINGIQIKTDDWSENGIEISTIGGIMGPYTVTINPLYGYSLGKIKYRYCDDEEIELTGNTFETPAITEDNYYNFSVTVTISGSSTPTSYYVDPTQNPTIEADEGVTYELTLYGTKLAIGAKEGYELYDVTVNGVSKGQVTELTGLKTGDVVKITSKKQITNEDVKSIVSNIKAKASSKYVTKDGNKYVKVKLNLTKGKDDLQKLVDEGYQVKYVFYKSTKDKISKYNKSFTTKKAEYTSVNGKDGVKYYYRGVLQVYDKNNKLVASTKLKDCKYALRTFKKK